MAVENRQSDSSFFYLTTSLPEGTPAKLLPRLIEIAQHSRKWVNASTVDTDGTILGDRLVGLNFGDADEYRKTRIFRDEPFNRLRVQKNTGTDATPVWVDLQYIDLTTGDVTVLGKIASQSESPSTFEGGIAVGDDIDLNGHRLVNFYMTDFNAIDFTFKASAVAADFSASREWTHTHNLNSVNILWNVYDDQNVAIIPEKVDVSNPNVSYFYFFNPQAGKAVVIGGMTGPAIVQVTDGVTTISNETVLEFEQGTFYVSADPSDGHPIVHIKDFSAGIVDHGDLTGLADDDHPQYLLRAEASSGFYGVTFRESDDNPPAFRSDTLTFDSAYFYVTGSGAGNKPLVSLRPTTGGSTALAQDFGIQPEWQFNHGLNSTNIVWSAYDDQQRAIIPDAVDISNPNIAYFYFVPAIGGRAVVLGGLNTAGQVGSQTGIVKVTDGSNTYNNQVVLNFSDRDFYLSDGGQSGSAVVNLTSRYIDHIQGFVETASVMNLAIDPWAPYDYRINSAKVDCREGTCHGGFYLFRAADRSGGTLWNGHAPSLEVNGMDEFAVSTTAQQLTPSGNVDVKEGDCLIFSISANTQAKWVRVSVKAERL